MIENKEIDTTMSSLDKVDKSGYYYRLYEEARNFDTNRFDEYEENLAYYEMKQDELPANQTNKPWVISITTPYAADATNTRVASLLANDYVGEIQPLAPDDVENIKVLNNVYRMFWNDMNMNDKVKQSILYSAVLRETYTHIIFDDKVHGGTNQKMKGKLTPYFIDPASMLIDPHALNFNDADYIVVTERITKQQYKRDYNKSYEIGLGSSFQPHERGEIYAGNDYDTNQQDTLTKLTFYIKEDDLIKKVVMVEKEILSEKDLPISRFPIAQLRWEKRIKSPYGKCLFDRVLPLQKSINAIESASTTAALAFSSPSYAVRAGSGVDPSKVAKLAGAPGAVFEVNGDPNNAIVPISNKNIDSNLITIKQDNHQELYRLAGVSEQFLGSFGSAGNTKGGSDEASQRARIIENLFLANLEEYIEELSRIIIEFATKAFEGDTLFSRGAKKSDGSFDFQQFDVTPDLKEIEYSFYIDMDIRTPYSKKRTKEMLQELYQMERQYDAPVKTLTILDILEQYNIPNIEELVQRYKQLTIQDTKMKADIITQWVVVSSENGIDANIISQGISEIINGKETPTVDQTIQMITVQKQREEQQEIARQQKLAQTQTQVMQQQMMQQEKNMSGQPQLTGDEQFGGEQPQLTGDEQFI